MPPPAARDLALLDAVDAMPRSHHAGEGWRVCRAGRDPLLGAPSDSRWCNGTFEVLYTSQARDGAIAEVHAYLDLQPVFPSKLVFGVHHLALDVSGLLVIEADVSLSALGIDPATYPSRRYGATQAVADAAFFLGFTGLVAPSARWPCRNVMLFTDRLDPGALRVQAGEADPVDWAAWRRRHRS